MRITLLEILARVLRFVVGWIGREDVDVVRAVRVGLAERISKA